MCVPPDRSESPGCEGCTVCQTAAYTLGKPCATLRTDRTAETALTSDTRLRGAHETAPPRQHHDGERFSRVGLPPHVNLGRAAHRSYGVCATVRAGLLCVSPHRTVPQDRVTWDRCPCA